MNIDTLKTTIETVNIVERFVAVHVGNMVLKYGLKIDHAYCSPISSITMMPEANTLHLRLP